MKQQARMESFDERARARKSHANVPFKYQHWLFHSVENHSSDINISVSVEHKICLVVHLLDFLHQMQHNRALKETVSPDFKYLDMISMKRPWLLFQTEKSLV
jgi:hypothetical protein